MRRWIHHNDCFWCIRHTEIPIEMKRNKVIRVKEHCQLHGRDIPAPYSGGRWCVSYVQRNCGCNICDTIVTKD